MTRGNLGDKLLVMQIKTGSKQAMCNLYEKYWRLVFSVSLKITHSSEDSEDVTQTIFCRIISNPSLLDEEKSIKDYLCQSARNESIDLLRKSSKVTCLEEEEKYIADEKQVASKIETSELLETMSEVLAETELAIILSYYQEDKTCKQIAKELGMSVDAITSILTRARRKLRESESFVKIAKGITDK